MGEKPGEDTDLQPQPRSCSQAVVAAALGLLILCIVPFASRHLLLADALPQHKDHRLTDLLRSHDHHDALAPRPVVTRSERGRGSDAGPNARTGFASQPANTVAGTTATVTVTTTSTPTPAPVVVRSAVTTPLKATTGSSAATAAAAAAAAEWARKAQERAARGELAPPPPVGPPVERAPDVVSAQLSGTALQAMLHSGNPRKAAALQNELASLSELDQELMRAVMELGPQQRIRLALHDQMRQEQWHRSEDGRFIGAVAMNQHTVPGAHKPLLTPWMDRKSLRTPRPRLRDLGKVTAELRHLLPEQDPFAPIAHKTCAVVGSGGILLNEPFGAEIDAHDAVFRFNVAPTIGFEKFVGSKTTVRMVNRMHFAFRETEEEMVLQHVTTDDVMKYFVSLLRKNPGVRTYALDMSFYDSMIEWYRVQQPTNGFFGLKLALLLCDTVTVYGFVRTWKGHYPYHYFNDEIPNDTQFKRDSGGELPLLQRLVHHYGASRLRFRHPCVLSRVCPRGVCAQGSHCEKGSIPYPVPRRGYCVRHVGATPGTPEEGQVVTPPLPSQSSSPLKPAHNELLRSLPSAVRAVPSSPMLALAGGATECFMRCLDETQCPGGAGPKGLCREDIAVDAAGDGSNPDSRRLCGGGGGDGGGGGAAGAGGGPEDMSGDEAEEEEPLQPISLNLEDGADR